VGLEPQPDNIHVLPENSLWSVRDPHNPVALSSHGNREDAVRHAREEAVRRGCGIAVHAADGSLESKELAQVPSHSIGTRLRKAAAMLWPFRLER
jgi:hypothetical protein